MTEREKVVDDLEEQIAWIRDNDFHKFPGWGHAVLAMRDAIALLKEQEPRAMTLREVQKIASIRDGAIWLEAGAGLMPAFMEFATKDITFFVAVPLTGYRQFFENDWYGKTWRCWTSRPTDEQREAVKWQ